MKTVTDIEGKFREKIQQMAASRGLGCRSPMRDDAIGQSRHMLELFRETDHRRDPYWLLYYSVRGPEDAKIWELRPSLIFDLQEETRNIRCEWGVLLVDGSPTSGYFLRSRHVHLLRQKWPQTENGNYRLTEEDLRNSRATPYNSMEELANVLNLTPGM